MANTESASVKVTIRKRVHAEGTDYLPGDEATVTERTAKFLTLRGLAELNAPVPKPKKSKAKPVTNAER
tara:strand:- start:294 stop:500 length:207 start_codon:yes stop_codon:yes gene_type:complete